MRLDRGRWLRLRCVEFLDQHILRQGQHNRAGTAGGGNGKGAAYKFRNAPDIIDLAHPFGEFGKGAAVFDFLKGFTLTRIALHLADEQDHRNGILHGDMQAG